MAMNPGMKMLMVAKAGRNGRMGSGNESRMESGGGQMNGNYSRIEGRQMGGYGQMTGEPEMRRRRDERGRFMEGGGNNGMMAEEMNRSNRQMTETQPQKRMLPGHDRENPYGDEPEIYKQQGEGRRMESYGGEINYERPDGNRGNISYFKSKPEQDPLEQHKMGFKQMEHGDAGSKPFDKKTAMEWVESMEDKEGVKGGAYTWHQAQQYGRNLGIVGEERLVEFYAAMNAMYSDFRPVAKKFGVDKPEFYAHMAKCFIEDPDAVEDKVEAYYKHIAKHDN